MREPVKYGNYYLFERVNIGGMAEVFKGVSYGVEGFERLFAVKRVLPSIAEDQEFIEMFIDEAKIAVQLNHANIGQIFELGNADNSYFIAMEFVQGKDLRALFDRVRKRVDRGERIDPTMACHIIKDVCEALEYAHNKRTERQESLGLVHRDVSPHNIIVSYEGEVKLIDFGIAKAAGKASKTQAGILKGKFGYMSPEQVRGRSIDRRSDLFSLGVVLFELLTLERCFQGESDFSTLEKVRNVDIRRPTAINREIPPELERIVLKALSRNPEERYQSASDFQDALQKYLYQSGAFYARKDLSQWMRRTFDADLREEQRKLQAFREYARANIPEARRASSLPQALREPDTLPTSSGGPADGGPSSPTSPTSPSGSHGAYKPKLPTLSWEEDEITTAIYDRELDEDPAADGPGSRAPEAAQIVRARLDGPSLPLPTAARLAVNDLEAVLPGEMPALRSQRSSSRLTILAGIALIAVILAAVAVVFVIIQGPGTSALLVETRPRAVTVTLDDIVVHEGPTPYRLASVAPGPHKLRLSAPGHQTLTRELVLEAGREDRLIIDLPVAKPNLETGLFIQSEPGGARVSLDGQPASDDVTPLSLLGIAAGDHELRLEKSGFQPWAGTITVPPNQVTQVKPIRLVPQSVSLKFLSQPAQARVTLQYPDGRTAAIGLTPISFDGLENTGKVVASIELVGYAQQTRVLGQYQVAEASEIFDLEVKAGTAGRSQSSSSVGPRRPLEPGAEDSPEGERETAHVRPNVQITPPTEPAAAPEPGFLNVQAKPPAVAFINDQQIGETPVIRHSLPAGTYRLVLIREATPRPYRREFTAEVRPGETNKIVWVEP